MSEQPASGVLRDPCPEHDSVAVFGMGSTGRAAARLLASLGKRVVASDDRAEISPGQLPTQVELRAGGLDRGDARVIVLSPGLNPEWPENRSKPAIAALPPRRRGRLLGPVSEVEVARAAYGGRVVAVGGTDGKSTTSAMAAHLLRELGLPTLLGGNSWQPFSEVLVEANAESDPIPEQAVIEVSAFQLWSGTRFPASAAILTNIQSDHLDHYADEAQYVAAKLRLLDGLDEDDLAILYAGDSRLRAAGEERRARGELVALYGDDGVDAVDYDGRAYAVSTSDGDRLVVDAPGAPPHSIPASALRLPGEHNRRNSLAALLAVSFVAAQSGCDVSSEELGSALSRFRGLPHRVEFVRELDGVRWFDDSKATNVHAAVAGLSALDRPLVVIAGGVDKALDLTPFVEALAERAHLVVVIGELRRRLGDALTAAGVPATSADSLEEAVAQARGSATPGDAVLLSPAASSFDMFGGFEERGRAFQQAVLAL